MAEPLSTGWLYVKSGAPTNQQVGPLTWEQLHGLRSSGQLQPADLVWHPTMPQWLPAVQVSGLFPSAAPSPVYQPSPYQQSPYAQPPFQQAPYRPSPYQQTPYPQAGQPPWQGYGGYPPAAQKRTNVAAWLIPLIALILVGGGLGAYFGFWHNKGGAVSASELVGRWEGNFTYKSLDFKDDASDEDLALRDQVLGKSIPATLDVTLDSGVSSLAQLSRSTNGGQKTVSGTAELTMDLSSVDETLGTVTDTMTFSYSDGRLTFTSTDSVGGTESVTASVSRSGDLLSMEGAMTFEDDTSSGNAVWKVTMESKATTSTQTDEGDDNGGDSTDSGNTTDSSDGSGDIVPSDLNGSWSGSLTITSSSGDPWAERGLTASLLSSITGLPIPVTMEISADESGTGTGRMVVSATALGAAFDIGTADMPLTTSGTTLTFQPESWPWGVPTMIGEVTQEGGVLTIEGTFSYASAASSFDAVFNLTK